MGMGHRAPLGLHFAHGRGTGAVGAAPARDQQLALGRAIDGLRGNVQGDVGHLLGPQIDHVLVVRRLVIDVAGDVLLFQAADAVHQARRAGNRPRAGQALVAGVGMEHVAVGQRARDA